MNELNEERKVKRLRPFAERKTLDRAFVLPCIGLVLLMPPLASVFHFDALLLGVPITAVYLFAVWGGLIIGAALLSRRLRSVMDSHDENSEANRKRASSAGED